MSSMGETEKSTSKPSSPNAHTASANVMSQSVSGEASQSQALVKKSHKVKSDVWDHFTRFNNESGKAIRAECTYCHASYSYTSVNGTSTLWKHLDKCAIYPFSKDKKQKTLSFEKNNQGGESNLLAWKFDQELCRQALAKMIIIDELPFIFIEREGFKNFCNIMQPRFRLVSRTTIARDCLDLYAREKKKLKSALATTKRICLTIDCWTTIQNMGYMCLTAHFIDNDWKLHKRILNFSLLSSHKGVAIGQAIEACMLQWEIDKVFTITMDNASSNDTAVAYLKKKLSIRNGFVLDGEFFHMRCCAHILNLIVRDGIDEVKDSIARIRGAVRYIRSSPQRVQQFKACCEHERIASKSLLCLDVPTRWNYTYFMLETAIKFQKAFERMNELESHFASDLKDGVPNESDWDNARVLIKFLKYFYEATKRISGSLYVTANSYFHEICAIEQLLHDWSKSSDPLLCLMAMKMKDKFDKYWGNIDKMNMMLLVAVVLDPRYKLRYVQFCYGRIYPLKNVDRLIRSIRELLNQMYVYYQNLDSSSSSFTSKAPQSSITMELQKLDGESSIQVTSLQSEFLKYLEEEEIVDSKSEVDRYLEEGVEKEMIKFEILDWWKSNSSKYRILSQMARDVLATPISTIVSESAFSTGGRVLDPFRGSLTPKLVECLICTQDWLRASPTSIEVEEKLEELQDIESFVIEDPELVATSQ